MGNIQRRGRIWEPGRVPKHAETFLLPYLYSESFLILRHKKEARILYLTEGLEKKKEKIIRKLESGKLQPSVHVITLAISEKNQLEIYPTLQFKQPAFPEQDLFVVGITKGYEEAVELVEQIVQEVYEQTGGCDIRSYILEKEQGR